MTLLAPPPGSIGTRTAGAAPRPPADISFDRYQQAVIDCDAPVVVAKAFAGAGKTTTARGYANARPEAKILYICLNKANQMEAAATFGPNVEARTSHSLAYGEIGHRFKSQIVHSWKARAFASEMSISDARIAASTQSLLTQFFHSRDREIDEGHALGAQEEFSLSAGDVGNCISIARLAWSRMQTPGHLIGIPHDAYLKMWALKKPVLSKYTHIILDEAQDSNPVTAEVIERQRHAKRLLIGDPHQSIYLFRGAVNAMEHFESIGATVLPMPNTWRFGPAIADMANTLLGFFKMESTQIIGCGPVRRNNGGGSPRAVLARTNVGLFAEAAVVHGKDTHWIGGVESARLDLLLSAYSLYCGKRSIVTDPVMASYPSWSAYQAEAEATRDTEANILIRMVNDYRHDLPKIVSALRSNAVPTQEQAKLVLSTGHKAKGLDWDRVTLAEDFSSLGKCLAERLTNPHQRMPAALEQEINLLYVALTRGRIEVTPNRETHDFLRKIGTHLNALVEAGATNQPPHPSVPVGG